MTQNITENQARYDNAQEALWKVLAESDETIDQVIPFRNDDAPRYLEALRQFEEESSKVSIEVG